MKKVIYLILLFLSVFGCGKLPELQEDQLQQFSAASAENYFRNVTSAKVYVYYEPGAEPFVGNQVNGNPLWRILDENLEKIFSYRTNPPSRQVPTSLNEMNSIPSQNKNKWSTQDVFELYEKYNAGISDSKKAKFYVYFVNGHAKNSNNIIGFNIGETPIIVIFKDVIRGTGGNFVQRYVEQSTLVHEMGHALGLVNNGVPMKQPHQDSNNGAHTNNSECVMYYLNEGSSDMAIFVGQFISGGDVIMWGPEVLSDIQKFSQ